MTLTFAQYKVFVFRKDKKTKAIELRLLNFFLMHNYPLNSSIPQFLNSLIPQILIPSIPHTLNSSYPHTLNYLVSFFGRSARRFKIRGNFPLISPNFLYFDLFPSIRLSNSSDFTYPKALLLIFVIFKYPISTNSCKSVRAVLVVISN